MLVSNKESHDGFYVTFDETDIYYIHNRNVRGVCIDSNLNFNEKISQICTKASKQLHVLQKLKSSLDKKESLGLLW